MDEIVALDIVYPGWSLSTFDHSWNWMAIAVADFYEREGRRPSQEAKNSEEKKLGKWLVRQRGALRNGTLRVDRRAWLDEHYPTWNKSFDNLWDRTARSATAFYEREGRHPSATSKNSNEKALGQWLSRQRAALKDGTLRPDRRAWLDENYPTWANARP